MDYYEDPMTPEEENELEDRLNNCNCRSEIKRKEEEELKRFLLLLKDYLNQ